MYFLIKKYLGCWNIFLHILLISIVSQQKMIFLERSGSVSLASKCQIFFFLKILVNWVFLIMCCWILNLVDICLVICWVPIMLQRTGLYILVIKLITWFKNLAITGIGFLSPISFPDKNNMEMAGFRTKVINSSEKL